MSAAITPIGPASAAKSNANTIVLTTPIDAKRTSCPARRSARMSAGSRCRGAADLSDASPRANRPIIRQIPRRSSVAVLTTSTLESASSTQSTGTSCTRRPLCSASASSSVSKNHPSSSTIGSSSRAMSARTALNPHCASETPLRRTTLSSRLYTREMNSRFGPRTTCAAEARRVPTATSLWPDTSGATSGRSASRSVDRSTSM